jgi:hypothetical protein
MLSAILAHARAYDPSTDKAQVVGDAADVRVTTHAYVLELWQTPQGVERFGERYLRQGVPVVDVVREYLFDAVTAAALTRLAHDLSSAVEKHYTTKEPACPASI